MEYDYSDGAGGGDENGHIVKDMELPWHILFWCTFLMGFLILPWVRHILLSVRFVRSFDNSFSFEPNHNTLHIFVVVFSSFSFLVSRS